MQRVTKEMQQAFAIASEKLRECYGEEGIRAGKNQFNNYWARDGFFSTFGAVHLHDYEIVKRMLDLFLTYQRKNGHLPRSLSRSPWIRALTMGLRMHMKEHYFKGFLTYYSRDQNALFIIATWEYMKKSKDHNFVVKNFEKILL